MERIALEKLAKWKDDPLRKPLIIWGARQVGKTYLAKNLFAEKYYPGKYIYIDFKIEDAICEFCSSTANAERIIEYISLSKGKIIDKDTLLIFDEIQECPNIISSLKYFSQDYREIPVIATGSMVRIRLQRESHKRGGAGTQFLFPVGKIDQMTVYPMTYDEYLANENPILYRTVKESYKNRVPLDGSIHDMAMDSVYRYMLAGGMPEAVETYLTTRNLSRTLEVLKSLYDNYLDDMELYQASREAYIRSVNVFSNIYRELSKKFKNFSPGMLEKSSKTRDYSTAIQWLTPAYVITQSFQLKEHVTVPLVTEDTTNFRLFLSDIGMFSYQSGINAASFVSKEREKTLSGIFFENYVANQLSAKGIRLFYWRGKASAELEFVVESANRLFPIDVKKGRGVLNSLSRFADHNSFEYAIKISSNRYGFQPEAKLMTVPLYATPFLAEDLADGTMPDIRLLK